MKKTTCYGLATFCGVGSILLGLGLWMIIPRSSDGASKPLRVEQDFLAIGNALKLYKINAGHFPTTEQGLEALVSKPALGPEPRRWGQMLKESPMDPWRTPYRYTRLSADEADWRWQLRSAGQDQVFGSEDDFVHEN